jgi:hypothetical protein
MIKYLIFFALVYGCSNGGINSHQNESSVAGWKDFLKGPPHLSPKSSDEVRSIVKQIASDASKKMPPHTGPGTSKTYLKQALLDSILEIGGLPRWQIQAV